MNLIPPYRGDCPSCGHRFTLADLLTMAHGDGFRRFICAWDGEKRDRAILIDSLDFAPHVMTAAAEGDGWAEKYRERMDRDSDAFAPDGSTPPAATAADAAGESILGGGGRSA